MADNKIEIIASLDIPKSKHNIAGELKQLQADIQADKSMRPKIIAGLDISKSKTLIQSQLNTIVNQANAPTIKVGIDVSQTKNIGATINEQLSKTNASSAITDKMVNDYRKYFQLVGAEASEINGKLKPLLTSFANAFNTENVEQYYAVLKQIVDLTTRMSKESAPKNVNELISATKAQVTDGSKVYIDSKTRGDLKNMINDARELRSILNSVFGGGKWTFDSKKGGVPFDTLVSPELLNRCNGLADCITTVHSQITALKGERVPLFEGMSNAQIQSTIELYTQELLKLGATTQTMENEWVDITNGVNTTTQAMSNNIAQMANVQQVYANTSSTLEKVKQDYAQLYGVASKDVTANWNRDAQDNIKGFTVEITKAKGVVESFKYELDSVSNSMQYIYKGGRGSDKGIKTFEKYADRVKAIQTNLTRDIQSIQNRYLDQNTTKPIKDTGHIEKLNAQYKIVEKSIANLANADNTTMASMRANVDKEIAKLKDLERQYRNAEYAANQLRTKDIGQIKSEQFGILDKFKAQVDVSKIIDTSGINAEISRLKELLNTVTNSAQLTDFLNKFDVLKIKFSALNTEAKTLADLQKSITTAIGNLDSKKLNSTFTRNNTNPEVVQQIAKIDELKAKYQNLLSLISQPQTPESFTKLRNETLLLDRDYQLLIQSVKNFQGTLRNDKTIDVNANKIKQLRAEIQAYMNLNPKAMNMKLSGGNTVGAELNRMLSQLNDLASPELAASIGRQFTTIQKTVVSMGKEGNTAFGSLLASAKKFGAWMGLTTIISRFVRSIRSMITTVIELDTALTDLKKTFKGTEQDLQAFYSNAPSIAKEFGVSTKDIIEQASAWSRLNKIGLLYGNI